MSTPTGDAGTAARGATPLTFSNYLAYAAGDAGNNFAFALVGSFLMLYYTDVIGISAAVVGTMLLVLRVVDGFTDLMVGRLIDMKRPGRLGRFRPFILWFSIPLLLMNVVLFSADVIAPGMSEAMATAYMYITYFLVGSVFYTLVNIAYGAMAPAMTQNPIERSRLAAFRTYGAILTGLAINFTVAPQIRGNEGDPGALQRALLWTTLAFVVLGILMYGFMIMNTRERVLRPSRPVTLRDSWSALRTNRPIQILALSSVLYLTGMMALQALGAYIALQVIGNSQFIAWNALAQAVPLFIVGPLIPRIVRIVGKRAAYMIMAGASVVGGLLLAFLPIATVPATSLVAFFVMGIGITGANTLMWALEADTVDYGHWRSGNRAEGTLYAVFSFTRKVGQALGGYVGAGALVWAGYSADRAAAGRAQADGVAQGIQMYGGLLIAGFSLLAVLAMLLYPLTEARLATMTAEITARTQSERAQGSTTAPQV